MTRLATFSAALFLIAGFAFGISTADAALIQNGVVLNGIALNGVSLNGVALNGLSANGVTAKGFGSYRVSGWWAAGWRAGGGPGLLRGPVRLRDGLVVSGERLDQWEGAGRDGQPGQHPVPS
jgi:hypothetical protein